MTKEDKLQKSGSDRKKRRKIGWFWPLGLAATGVAGLALIALRGCWHRRMSWPVRAQGRSYQVCLDCGIKRLFDEKSFCSYGPYRYDLNELAAWDRERREHARSTAERRSSQSAGSRLG